MNGSTEKTKRGVITGVPKNAGMDGIVYVNGFRLRSERSQREVSDHTLTKDYFSWGHGSTGGIQLAAAILLEMASREEAKELHMKFYDEVVSNLPFGERFELQVSSVERWLRRNRDHGLKTLKRQQR